jgi:hypothetical protein
MSHLTFPRYDHPNLPQNPIQQLSGHSLGYVPAALVAVHFDD